MKIKTVSKTERGEYVILTLAGEKKAFVLTGELYCSLGEPKAEYELSCAEYDEIISADEHYRATKRALNILSYGDNSRRKLYEKLRRGGFGAELSARICEDMAGLGYIDEQRQIRDKLIRLANDSLFGSRKIIARLASAGYRPSDVSAVLSDLRQSGEIDFEENFAKLCERLCPDGSLEELEKIKYKYGYK